MLKQLYPICSTKTTSYIFADSEQSSPTNTQESKPKHKKTNQKHKNLAKTKNLCMTQNLQKHEITMFKISNHQK
jgi:hypothetical protein